MYLIIEKYKRHIAIFFLINILAEVVSPTTALALTSGPAQPESASFEPVGTTDMVDPFTGDYTYNIPLLDVEGYPINLSYHSGVSMDQEASWVGLGWNINPGSINRSMRGLPDDFRGDVVKKEFNIKDNESYGVNIGASGKLFGQDLSLSGNIGFGVQYNNYTGYNFIQTYGLSINISSKSSEQNGALNLGLSSSADGADFSPSISFSKKMGSTDKATLNGATSLGMSYNSRTGLKSLSLGVSGNVTDREVTNKKDKSRASFGSGHSLGWNFATSTYVPQYSFPYKTGTFGFGATLGGVFGGFNGSTYLNGSYSKQSLKYNSEDIPAYGYMYSESGQDLEKVLLDFNREKDGAFTENTTDLHLTNFTYDVFSVSGQGVGGSYRAFRNDIGYVHDSRVESNSENINISGELHLGNTVHGDVDFLGSSNDSYSAPWFDDNSAASALKFTSKEFNNSYENVYFKESAEKTIDESGFYESLHGDKAMRIPVTKVGKDHYSSPSFESENSVTNPIVSKRPNAQGRVKRNQYFQYISYGDYDEVALKKSLKTSINTAAKDHHIAEITTVKTDGSRYVYGIPAYNTAQEECSFSIPEDNNIVNGLVNYTSILDDSKSNSRGVDNFFTKTSMPAYPYSYLLTAVLSPDYVDVTGNGPTGDDLGNYTIFNYTKTSTAYKWRTPYGVDGSSRANYDKALHTLTDDAKASYVRGEKEIWYLSSITTKNHIAIFELATRKDGYEANADGTVPLTPAGFAGMQTQRMLTSIKLYSTPDYTNTSTAPTVIKQVNFVYDYSLCPKVPNNSKATTLSLNELNNNDFGKLTLKQVYFTYGNSKKGQLSPYKFEYNTAVNNVVVDYDSKAYDRWGNYKPNVNIPVNSEYPYTDQNKTLTDQYARLWNLKQITLPSGGKINIDLESDDYAYVQNRKAMQMHKIVTCTNLNPGSSVNQGNVALNNTNLFTVSNNIYTNNGRYYLFNLSQVYTNSQQIEAQQEVLKMVSGIEDLYFRFYVNTAANSILKEYVSGYSKIKSSGIYRSTGTSGPIDYGWIELDLTGVDDNSGITASFSPVTKAAWQFARSHTPRISYAVNNNVNPTSATSFFQAIKSSFQNIVQVFQGANGALAQNGVGGVFDPNRSWVRFNTHNGRKLGGGVRVKQITVSDEWATMLSTTANNALQSFNYGQEYTYNFVENSSDQLISSGVAAYEPASGADENPFKVPVWGPDDSKRKRRLLSPDDDFYAEEPFGESFFPSPVVGYSRVMVRNLHNDIVSKNGTGYVVNEFYTAKDFPTRTSRTTMLPVRYRDQPIFKVFNINFEDFLTATQGFAVELNDMHGKPKANSVYAQGQEGKISGVEYKYRLSEGNLDNSVPVIKPNGLVKYANVGIDMDVIADFRESKNTTSTLGVKANLYFFFVGPWPVFIPPFIPSYHKETTRFRSAVVTKVVNKYGILEETIVHDQSSSVSTKNMLWDSETGQVALTKTSTEFNDDIYSFAYPSHWAYDGMSHAYQNQGTNVKLKGDVQFSNYIDVNSTGYAYIKPGDELLDISSNPTAPYKFWVVKEGTHLALRSDLASNNYLVLSNSQDKEFRIIRSGSRNMQSVNVGAFTSFNSPVALPPNNTSTTTWPVLDKNYGVINATASEFKENWNTFCNCGVNPNPNLSQNPYMLGIVGNWRSNKQYTFLSLRDQTKDNGNSNLRKDGTFSVFTPFWNKPASGNIWTMSVTNWRSVNEVTEYSPFGYELENVDALNRYSSAQYGYNNSLPMAVASNARYRQMAFDGFEDYNYTNCLVDHHFGFKNPGSQAAPSVIDATATGNALTYQKFSHTGRRSIKVSAAAGQYEVVKPLKKCSSN